MRVGYPHQAACGGELTIFSVENRFPSIKVCVFIENSSKVRLLASFFERKVFVWSVSEKRESKSYDPNAVNGAVRVSATVVCDHSLGARNQIP